METLILHKDSPALNEFLAKRKMKYDVYNKQIYNIVWQDDALEIRKNFIRNKKLLEKSQKREKEVLSTYLKRKLEKSLGTE
jgi:hypothetical protein